MSLTGRFCFRRTFWGKVVLCVEEEKKAWFGKSAAPRSRWRDASLIDLTDHALRGLLELRDNAGSLTEQQRPIDLERPRPARAPAKADTLAWAYPSTVDGAAVLNGHRSSTGLNGEHREHRQFAT
jgi:hypothetical protein